MERKIVLPRRASSRSSVLIVREDCGVQAHHGLIDDQDLGLVHQRGGKDQLLTHAVRVIFDELIHGRGQTEKLEVIVQAAALLRPVDSEQVADEIEKIAPAELFIEVGAGRGCSRSAAWPPPASVEYRTPPRARHARCRLQEAPPAF